MSRTGVFFAEGFEEIEALTVVDLLRRAEIETVMVSVTGQKTVESSHKVTVETDILLENVDFDSLDMIVLPGGMPGTRHLEECGCLMEALEDFHRKEKYISAICAAPSILGHRGMLRGRRACCFPEFESHLEGAEVSDNTVETDGHIITSRGMGCAVDFGLAIVERFCGKDSAEELAHKIVYR